MAQLGKVNRLIIIRDSDHGFYLDGGNDGEILLPRKEVPEDVEQGDEVEVFISRDSSDRIVATTSRPKCEVDQFAALQVKDVNPKIGAFLDWEFAKDLLLPFREQVRTVRPGDWVVVMVKIDQVSGRIIATARTDRYLNRSRPDYLPGAKADFLIQNRTPLGYGVIVDQRYRGLLREEVLHRPLMIGDALEGYVSRVREDGNLDLSLEPVGFSRITGLGERIIEAARMRGGRLPLHDGSSPEEIRRLLQTSKKAFKQAAGTLYRQRKIRFEASGIVLVEEEAER